MDSRGKILPDPDQNILQKHRSLGYALRSEDGRWALTPKGYLISNTIIAELLEAQDGSQPMRRL